MLLYSSALSLWGSYAILLFIVYSKGRKWSNLGLLVESWTILVARSAYLCHIPRFRICKWVVNDDGAMLCGIASEPWKPYTNWTADLINVENIPARG